MRIQGRHHDMMQQLQVYANDVMADDIVCLFAFFFFESTFNHCQ